MARFLFSVKPSVFLVLSLALALALTAACSSSDDTTTSNSGTTAAPAAPAAPAPAPTASGIFAAPALADAAAMPVGSSPTGSGSTPIEASIDRVVFSVIPTSEESNAPGKHGPPVNVQLNPMYEYLIGMDPTTGAWVPELATSWSVEPDGSSIRFQLRKGVQFHDGWGEMKGKDVQHTYNDIAADDSSHGNHGTFKNRMQAVDIINDYEVVFRAEVPNAGLLWAITRQEQSILVQSKDHYDAVGSPTLATEPLAGTGVYQFESRRDNSFIRFEALPYKHWKMTPDFKEFEIRWIGEASTRLAGLLAKEIHVASIPEDLMPQATSAGMSVAVGQAAGLRTFFGFRYGARCPCNTKDRATFPPLDGALKFPDAPLHDIRVRKALNKAIDRDALNTAFFGDKGQIMYKNHHHPTRPGWDKTWVDRFPEGYGFDPAAAKALLAEAGYNEANPYEITLNMINLSHYSGSLDVVEAVSGYWNDIGVSTKLLTLDKATYNAKNRNFEFDNNAVITGTSSHILMGTRVYDVAYSPRVAAPENPLMDAIYGKLAMTLEGSLQADMLKQVGEIAYMTYHDIPLFWLPPEAMFNPEFVSAYVFPGSVTGTWTHLENIRAAK